MKIILTLTMTCGLMAASFSYAAVDADKAQAMLKDSGCFKCHAIDKKKDGPSYKEVAKKYKGKAEAEDTLIKHVTMKPTIIVDGQKEEHRALKTKDPAEVKNVVQFILSL